MKGLPGVPAMVVRARRVVAEQKKAELVAGFLGALASAALGGFGFLAEGLGAEGLGLALILAALFAWIPFVRASTSLGEGKDAVEDARAVLAAWGRERERWATEAIVLSIPDAAEEGVAQIRAERRLEQMTSRAGGARAKLAG